MKIKCKMKLKYQMTFYQMKPFYVHIVSFEKFPALVQTRQLIIIDQVVIDPLPQLDYQHHKSLYYLCDFCPFVFCLYFVLYWLQLYLLPHDTKPANLIVNKFLKSPLIEKQIPDLDVVYPNWKIALLRH